MNLTIQELSVLRLILLGQPDAGIAYLLNIPIGDVQARRRAIMKKAGVSQFLRELRASLSRQVAGSTLPRVARSR